MLKEFQYFEKVDTVTMTEYVGKMHELLEAIDEGLIPNNSEYTRNDLRTYLTSLIKNQRGFLGRTKPGSWSIAPDDDGMPSDARVDFIFRPTYAATATLARSLCEYPTMALSIPGYRIALHKGMVFCTYRGLQGHGYDSIVGMIDAFHTLSLGKVPWLLNRHPEFCPKLKRILDVASAEMKNRLAKGQTKGAWGEDYSDGFRSALETLKITNDLEYMKSISDAKNDPDVFNKEDLPW